MNEVDELIIHPNLLRKFLRYDKDFSNLLALYFFYLYQAKLQKTNSILATDNFTKNGIGWGLDKVKRIKRILKELKVITLTQKSTYSYIQILYIYTQKKTIEILKKITGIFKQEKSSKSEILSPKKETKKPVVSLNKNSKSEILIPNKAKVTASVPHVKPQEKSIFQKALEENHINSSKIISLRTTLKEVFIELNFTQLLNQTLLAKWIIYCEKNAISYNKSHLTHWIKNFQTYTTIELEKAIYTSITKKWKNFYMPELKDSNYVKYLGRDLMLDKHLKNLRDVKFKEDKFVYIFEKITITSKETIEALFEKYEYIKEKSGAIPLSVKKLLKGCFTKLETTISPR